MFKRVEIKAGPYQFVEAFGFIFGQRKKMKLSFGSRQTRLVNPTDVEIVLKIPSHEETDIRFSAQDRLNMAGDRTLIVSDHKGAVPGDDGVVAYIEYKNGPHRGGSMSLFSNDSGKDPKPIHYMGQEKNEVELIDRDTWLKSDSIYYLRLYRNVLHSSGLHLPLALEHASLGNDEEE